MADFKTDIAIIGGGASGLAAAISAKLTDKAFSVTILERLPKVGKKLLATGNGRCNLSNVNLNASNYHGSVDAIEIIGESPDVSEFFSELGVLTYSDSEGRIYPYSNSAATVLDTLRIHAEELGIEIKNDYSVDDILAQKSNFLLKSDNSSIIAKRVIITCGGCTQTALGSNGSGFTLARGLGIKVTELKPSLCPVPVKKSQLGGLAGVRVKATASLLRGGRLLKTEKGEVQFSENYISGICIFNLSRLAQIGDEIVLDLLDGFDDSTVDKIIEKAYLLNYNRPLDMLLSGIFNKKLAMHIVKRATKKPLTAKASELSKAEKDSILKLIKALNFTVSGSADFNAAQVTAGGVLGTEIDGMLQSKLHKGLFFAGEVLDADGDCGGYNLHFAWASGLVAGKAAAQSIKESKC